MPPLTIRHVTTYRYRQPVAFGEHRMMLRPRDAHDQRVIEADLKISPKPESLHFIQDAFGNHIAIARFSDLSTVLHFESTVVLEHSPLSANFDLEDSVRSFPLCPGADEMPDELAGCIERHHPDPEDEVGRWARQFLPPNGGAIGTFEVLTRISLGIHHGFLYRRREEKGIQEPRETIRLGHGSCRDFAMLMIEAARALGLAARFASGYRANMRDDPASKSALGAGSTHAWAQIHVPRAGWIDFDPTSGTAGKAGLITVAVVRDPRDATPLHGTFTGCPSDPLGMEVSVRVTSGSPHLVGATA